MKQQSVAPTGKEQPFEINELFFSTTDQHGIITAGNEVFSRTSGYSFAEMIGQPHNLIRHPHMPRAVFALLWQTVRARKPFLGYVINQARNGNHYWVFASIFPARDGYLSVRFKPSTPLRDSVATLYGKMLEAENVALASGLTPSEAMEASKRILTEALPALGFSTYDAFSRHCLNGEIKARDAALVAKRLSLFPSTVRCTSRIEMLYRQSLSVYESLNNLFRKLDELASLNVGMREKAAAVHELAENFRIDALNAHLASDPLGMRGQTLDTIANFLNGCARDLGSDVDHLASSITSTSSTIDAVASHLSESRLLLEVSLFFQAEIASTRDKVVRSEKYKLLRALHETFASVLHRTTTALSALRNHLPKLEANNESLRKDIITLQVAQISGLVEAAHLAESADLSGMFTSLRSQIEKAGGESRALCDVVARLSSLTFTTPAAVSSIDSTAEQIAETLSQIAA